jgi:radical SAM protein with 4Fe4S-binding SPASM domain
MIPYSKLQTLPRLDLALCVPLQKPLTLYIEPTNRCNLKCDFCPHSIDDFRERAGYHQHMDIALYRKIIDEIADYNLHAIKLHFFGESLLHPDICHIVALAKMVCPRVELTTNGILLTEARAKELLYAKLDYLRISYYDDIPNILQQHVQFNVARLFKLRTGELPFICVKVFDKEQFEVAYALYKDISDEIAIEGFHSMGSDLVHLGDVSGIKKACAYPFYNLVIKANGDVVPCCVAWEQSLVVGNINNEKLIDIWNGEKLEAIQRLHLEGRRSELAACANCNTLFICPDSVDELSIEEFNSRKSV